MTKDRISFAPPTWARTAARTCDISDIWVDEVDPENEEGVEATAFLGKRGDILHLDGISVNDWVTTFQDRAWAEGTIGLGAIYRIEQCEMEAAGDAIMHQGPFDRGPDDRGTQPDWVAAQLRRAGQ